MRYFEIISLLVIIFHGLLILIDEFYFHHKRKLPKWERIGHPIDTFFFLGCFLITIFFPMTKSNVAIFFVLAILSSLIIIKDEYIHIKLCTIKEHYLHILLIIIHPLLLINVFLSWPSFTISYFSILDHFKSSLLKNIIYLQFIFALLFLLYQIIYWNLIDKYKNS